MERLGDDREGDDGEMVAVVEVTIERGGVDRLREMMEMKMGAARWRRENRMMVVRWVGDGESNWVMEVVSVRWL
ncbi:hypothetical protein MRB53_024551 [Persea americana]|uniref:Uncharacterized protein n=1 Tax=Persea americana TaxID=3435 RepID=A0ACC2LDR4_PERAE|nr:hypothetical protein MRB53_024551 [Persea americana]